jgi:hypothetical protein
MTMGLHGHLGDGNPWQAARMVGAPQEHLSHPKSDGASFP